MTTPDQQDQADVQVRLRAVARRFARLNAPNEHHLALVGLALGAVYSLLRAVECGYSDRRTSVNLEEYGAYILKLAAELSDQARPSVSLSVGDYYFNSAVLRIAALSELVDQRQGERKDRARAARREANVFKHKLGALLLPRSISLRQALHYLEALSAVLDRPQTPWPSLSS